MPEKINRISVVLSKKDFLDGHKRRLIFIEAIKKMPVGEFIDIYGAGFNPIPDKWDVIAPYKYHLVFENEIRKDYWTEKLADAFLGFAYPIYVGCENIFDYFPREAMATLAIDDVSGSAEKLTDLLKFDTYSKHLTYITIARNKVLDDYNIFQLMCNICVGAAVVSKKCQLKPNNYFSSSWLRILIRNCLHKSEMSLYLARRLRHLLGI
jgi:hypothetical protein